MHGIGFAYMGMLTGFFHCCLLLLLHSSILARASSLARRNEFRSHFPSSRFIHCIDLSMKVLLLVLRFLSFPIFMPLSLFFLS